MASMLVHPYNDWCWRRELRMGGQSCCTRHGGRDCTLFRNVSCLVVPVVPLGAFHKSPIQSNAASAFLLPFFFPQVSMNALDPMLRRLLEEMNLLANDALTAINMTSPRFDYIWKVAYHQLLAGLWVSNTIYEGEQRLGCRTVTSVVPLRCHAMPPWHWLSTVLSGTYPLHYRPASLSEWLRASLGAPPEPCPVLRTLCLLGCATPSCPCPCLCTA